MVMSDMQKKLDFETSRLPTELGFHAPAKCVSASRPEGFRFSKHIINIEAPLVGRTLVLTGEAETEEVAFAKAYSEFLERLAFFKTTEANANMHNTNGWAAHPEPATAKLNAILELCERDSILKHWAAQCALKEITFASLPLGIRNWASSELRTSELPILKVFVTHEGRAPAVVCMLINKSGFGVTGHASGLDLESALRSAIAEACRAGHQMVRRSFWNDAIALRDADLTQEIQPGAHSVYYAYIEPLPKWIYGDFTNYGDAAADWNSRLTDLIRSDFKEFTFTKVLEGEITVGFASHPDCYDLQWGRPDGLWMGGGRYFDLFSSKNLKPHFVA
jgi:hypothetical protein